MLTRIEVSDMFLENARSTVEAARAPFLVLDDLASEDATPGAKAQAREDPQGRFAVAQIYGA